MSSRYGQVRHIATAFAVSVALSATLWFGGCSKESAQDQPASQPPSAKNAVFGDLVSAEERAKSQTEQAMKERNDQLKAAEEKAEQ